MMMILLIEDTEKRGSDKDLTRKPEKDPWMITAN
jgi:hypothetical protein